MTGHIFISHPSRTAGSHCPCHRCMGAIQQQVPSPIPLLRISGVQPDAYQLKVPSTPALASPLSSLPDSFTAQSVQSYDDVTARVSINSDRTLVFTTPLTQEATQPKTTVAACRVHVTHIRESFVRLWPAIHNFALHLWSFTLYILCSTAAAIALSLLSFIYSCMWYRHNPYPSTVAPARFFVIFATLGSIIPGVLCGVWFFVVLHLPSDPSDTHQSGVLISRRLRDLGSEALILSLPVLVLAILFGSLPLGAAMLRGGIARGLDMRRLSGFAAAGGGTSAVTIVLMILSGHAQSSR